MSTLQEQAQQNIQDNILKNINLLIEALKDNYRQYAIRGHQHYIEKGISTEYHTECIEKLKNGHCDIDYQITTGKKYYKVFFLSGGNKSVHCFVDKNTGEVYKPASWKAPAKNVRFDLRLIKDREWLFEHADWSGGYLYHR